MIKLELIKGRTGGCLGFKTMELVDYWPSRKLFKTLTDEGYQLISKREMLESLDDYIEVKSDAK